MNRLLRRVKDYFVPTGSNDYQPHFFRVRVALSVFAFIVLMEGVFLAHTFIIVPNSNYFAAIFASVLVDETNENRVAEKLAQLSPSPILEKAAQLKADDMALKGYFSHNAPDGKTPWYWFQEAGYDYAAAGENLAVNYTDSKDVTNAWLASPSHRANILNANYTEIGIATAKGTYKGKDAIFVVQEFGRPSLIARETSIASTSVTTVAQLITQSERNIPKATTTKKPATSSTSLPKVEPAVENRSPVIAQNSTTTLVAGVSSEKLSIASVVAPVDAPILTTVKTSFFEQLVASPRQTSTVIYLILAAILILALGLTIFVKIRVQYPHLITNGILLIAVIISFILLNSALGFTQAII